MKAYIINKLPLSFLTYLKEKKRKRTTYTFVQNVNWQPNNSNQKRVLFSYVFSHLFQDIKNASYGTRGVECAIMISEFIKNGYCLDLIDCRTNPKEELLNGKKYDLIFGFGLPFNYLNRKEINANRVLYLTEKHPQFSRIKEKERLDYYNRRHKKIFDYSRTGLYYKDEDFNNLDSIVYIGDPSDSHLIPVPLPKYSIYPTGLINDNYQSKNRNVSTSKKKFLWFGSLGAIHKGLDLLIDVFKNLPDSTLYIAGLGKLEEKMLPEYRDMKNIINVGFLKVNSSTYLDIVHCCSFVILPSCSEAMSTGVITCMNHGLIPIITKETGFHFKDFGYELSDFRIETISKTVKECSNLENDLILEQHKSVYNYSITNFSAEKFQDNFSKILRKIS